MSLHLEAKPGEVAPVVLITGDPLRAKHYAETRLTGAFCYNRIRNMLGFTGTYQGISISIQGTGIGIPSTALYLHELIHSYRAKRIIRIGTCGAIQRQLQLGELIVATEASTDSSLVSMFQDSATTVPKADPLLVKEASATATRMGILIHEGPAFSTDLFYGPDNQRYERLGQQGVLAVDMETSLLYALCQREKIQALSLLTVSDNILTGTIASAADREKKNDQMISLALELAITSHP